MVEIQKLLSWSAPEYPYHEKGGLWFAVLGAAALLLLAGAYLLNNFLLGVLVILSAFALALYGARRPKTVTFTLTPQGIRIDNRLYPYDNIRSFWIHYDPPVRAEISVVFKKALMPHIAIPLEDTDPNEVRDVLVERVAEIPHEESFSDVISRVLRF